MQRPWGRISQCALGERVLDRPGGVEGHFFKLSKDLGDLRYNQSTIQEAAVNHKANRRN